MAGGGSVARDYGGGLTFSVVATCLMAASCGLIFGYGSGITAPVYLSETAPAKWRGAFTSSYNAFVVFGVLFATITNYFTDHIRSWGWRISVGLAAIPGVIIFMGALFVSDTPSSLVMRGHPDRARAVLQHIRGRDVDIDTEFKDIVYVVDEACQNDEGAFRRLFSKQYRHYLVLGVAIPVFYEFTGMVVISTFSPVLFRTIGFNSQKAILGSVINTLMNLVATILSSFIMDHTGRNFGVSWAPLKFVVLSEIYPVEVRSAGQAMSVSIGFFLSFLELQVFTALLCGMKYAVFLFYAAWLLAMTVFVALLLPETKGVPLEVMRSVWAQHWYWRRFAKG
nr:unnamed protein product [Digitaria exilis]